jgi:raffinose/stachyose/melibiose transport system substrate-binding protein
MSNCKRVSLLILVFLLSFALAACGTGTNNAGDAQGQQNEPKEQTQPKDQPKEPAKTEEPKKATISVFTQSIEPKELLQKFNKEYPHITVKWEQVDSKNISQVLKTRIAAGGENLDVVTPQRSDYLPLIEAGAFLDISDQPFLKQYDDAAIESGKVNGKVYGIPLTQQAYLVWYNKDVFAKHGLKVPTNWEEFLAVSETLKKNGIAPIALAGKDEWVVNVFAGLAYSGLFSQEPNWLAKAAKGEVKWTDKGSVDALNKIKTLVDKGYILEGALGTGYDQAYQAFYQGKAAMTVNGAWSIDLIINTPPSFEVGAFVPPGNDKGQPLKVAFIPGNVISIASASKNKEASQTFLNFLSQPENASLFATTIKQFSSAKGASADFHPATKIVQPIFNSEKTQMFHAEVSAQAKSVVGKELQKLIAGESTPAQVAEEVQKAQQKDIK